MTQPPAERSLGLALFALLFLAVTAAIAPLLVSTGFTNGVGAGPFVARIDAPLVSDGRLVATFRVGNEGSVAGAATCSITSARPGEGGFAEIITTKQIAPGEIIETRRILTRFDGTVRPLAISCGSRPWPAATTVAIDPTPEPTPTPSATPTPSDGASPSPAPSTTPAPSGDLADGYVIAAMGVAFDLAELRVPADRVIGLRFDNDDAGIPHNVAIHEGTVDAVGKELWQGAIFSGIATQTYEVPALAAGSYVFLCTVHPNMVGAWIAE